MATWKTKDGTEIKISEMGDSHLVNIIKMLERNADDAESSVEGYFDEYYYDRYLSDTPYDNLVNEAKKRNLIS